MKKTLFPFAILIAIVATAFAGKPKGVVKLHKSFMKEFTYVPNGALEVESVERKVSAFYMSKTEVSNIQYRNFLAAMDTADAGTKKIIAIQNDNWAKGRFNGEPYADYYSSHEAYNEYPVVNISHEAAQLYCDWLTAEYRKLDIGLPENMQLSFRLPEHAEWMHAARGEFHGPYAWGGPYLRNKQGCELANFSTYGAENITYDEETETYKVVPTDGLSHFGVPGALNSTADVTAPVLSYAPNSNQLYNMNGNAAEMLARPGVAAGGCWASPGYDIRNESLMDYEVSSPCVGFRPVAVLTAL